MAEDKNKKEIEGPKPNIGGDDTEFPDFPIDGTETNFFTIKPAVKLTPSEKQLLK